MARKMKDSGIEWIGEIPEGWEVAPLKRFASIQTGNTPSKTSDSNYYASTGIPWIKPDNLGYSHSISKTSEHLTSEGALCARIMPPNTVYVCCIGSLGKVGYSSISCACNQQINALIFNDLMFWKYGYYLTIVQESQYLLFGNGNVLKIINSTSQGNIACVLPPLENQHLIACYLDSVCSDIEVLISKARSSIEEYKKLKQAVITQAVTKGARGEREMKDSGNPWFGQIPTDWKLSRVGLHFSIILGKMLCNAPLNDTYTLEPYYCAADVHFDGVADGERKKMWFSPIEKDLYRVSVGDLLVVEGGAGAGGSAIVENQDSDTYIQNSIMIVRSKGNSDNRYLRYLLEFLVKQGYIDIVCNKATIPHFTKDKLSCIPFCLCPTGEQEEIADYLDTKCAEIDGLIAKKEQLVKELESYKKSLIYEVVTGKREV